MKAARPLPEERTNDMSAISCHQIIKRYGDTQVAVSYTHLTLPTKA
mgnify:CR=1 FL=1